MRRQTLFEVMAEGTMGVVAGAPAPTQTLHFEVEHPGIEHTLMVAPSVQGGSGPDGPAEVAVKLTDAAGATPVTDQREYTVRTNSSGLARIGTPIISASPPPRRVPIGWRVTTLTVQVPALHIRVEDPQNTDGQRIPGY